MKIIYKGHPHDNRYILHGKIKRHQLKRLLLSVTLGAKYSMMSQLEFYLLFYMKQWVMS